MIKDSIDAIDWKKIMYYHKALNIQWQIEEESGNIIERLPRLKEIQEELIQLLKFAIEKDLKVLDYGNWIIYWSNEKAEGFESGALIEIIFSLDSYMVSDDTVIPQEILDELNEKMQVAIDKEDYEEAALIRDKIKKIVHNKCQD